MSFGTEAGASDSCLCSSCTFLIPRLQAGVWGEGEGWMVTSRAPCMERDYSGSNALDPTWIASSLNIDHLQSAPRWGRRCGLEAPLVKPEVWDP